MNLQTPRTQINGEGHATSCPSIMDGSADITDIELRLRYKSRRSQDERAAGSVYLRSGNHYKGIR